MSDFATVTIHLGTNHTCWYNAGVDNAYLGRVVWFVYLFNQTVRTEQVFFFAISLIIPKFMIGEVRQEILSIRKERITGGQTALI